MNLAELNMETFKHNTPFRYGTFNSFSCQYVKCHVIFIFYATAGV